MPSTSILFLGDCNTLGTPDIQGHAYPEQLRQFGDFEVMNCGHTMATIREGSEYFSRRFRADTHIVCVQYGLVDAWRTFRCSPYVLYYPDSTGRKLARKLVKKYKKLCHRLGLHRLFGSANVVPEAEYARRIQAIIDVVTPKPVILIETVPNHDLSRNSEIRRYNARLQTIADTHANVLVLPLYDEFSPYLGEPYNPHSSTAMYCDPTHLSKRGHRLVAERLYTLIKHVQ